MEIPSTLCSNVYDFAFCPEPCYERLADLADPEDWGPGNRILKNYLSFSFSRAVFLTERDVDQTAPSNLPLVFDDDRCLFKPHSGRRGKPDAHSRQPDGGGQLAAAAPRL